MKRVLYLHRPPGSKKLATFAEACLSLSPRVLLYQDCELFIDMSPTLQWFGGEEKWLNAFEKLRQAFTVTVPYVIADRLQWAKAFYDVSSEAAATRSCLVIPPSQSQQWLWQSPIEKLMVVGNPMLLAAERQDRTYLVSFMRRVGLNQISDFARLDTTAISRRFGKMGILLQAWLTADQDIPFPAFVPKETIKETEDTDDLESNTALICAIERALSRIAVRLTARGECANAMRAIFKLDAGLDGKSETSEWINFHEPVRETSRLLQPVREYLSQPRWESPLLSVEFEVTESSPYTAGQLSLIDTTENKMADLGHYIQKLRARLGERAVGFAQLQPSYLPEKSWKKVWPPPKAPFSTRPFIGMRPPVFFSPARPYTLAKYFTLTPSESIAAEWWETAGAYRRYFIAHAPHREKLWIYWDYQKKEWFLQGAFD